MEVIPEVNSVVEKQNISTSQRHGKIINFLKLVIPQLLLTAQSQSE
jgi:hypothetical protein